MSWAAREGQLTFYDKAANDGKGENIAVGLPFTFLLLDSLSCIAGYSKADKRSYYSNEIHSTKKEPLTVRMKGRVVETNLYEDLFCMRKGAKYAKALYVAYKDVDNKLVIGHIKVWGSAVSAWIDYDKNGKEATGDKKYVYKGAIKMDRGGKLVGDQGGEYYPPTFTQVPITDETNQQANDLTGVVEKYLLGSRPASPAEITPEAHEDNPPARPQAEAPVQTTEEMAEERLDDERARNVDPKNKNAPAPANDLPF